MWLAHENFSLVMAMNCVLETAFFDRHPRSRQLAVPIQIMVGKVKQDQVRDSLRADPQQFSNCFRFMTFAVPVCDDGQRQCCRSGNASLAVDQQG